MNDLKYVLINVICFLMLSCGAVIKGSGCGADRVPSKTAYRMVFSSGPRHFDSADQAKKILDDQRVQEGQKKAAENLQSNYSAIKKKHIDFLVLFQKINMLFKFSP